ncbi:hypothetical protein GCM10020331_031090 [Ectobacillus funiculus]
MQQGSHLSSEKKHCTWQKSFEDKGEITGSWIHMVPEVLERYNLTYDVYRGGITALIDGMQERFEFF